MTVKKGGDSCHRKVGKEQRNKSEAMWCNKRRLQGGQMEDSGRVATGRSGTKRIREQGNKKGRTGRIHVEMNVEQPVHADRQIPSGFQTIVMRVQKTRRDCFWRVG